MSGRYSVSTYMSVILAVLILLGGVIAGSGVLAQGAAPSADATPGAVDVGGAVLGGIEPVVAPDYRLEMFETEWAPGSYVTMHTHPMALVACVVSGSLGFSIQHGAATLTRGGSGEEPEAIQQLELNTEYVLEPRDCVAFDHFATHTVHTAWNASDETTILWEADLLKLGEPPTTFVNAQGTPVS